MFLSYQQVACSNVVVVLNTAITIPPKATHCQIQADTANIRFRMDGSAPTSSVGALLLTTEPPRDYLIEDVARMKFLGDGGSAANLNLHFFAGRDV